MKNLYKIEDELYIISDTENLNEIDFIVTTDNRLVQVSYLLSKDLEGASKVILTTNKLLIKEGVQAIDDEFLNWFVKNPSCEEVEVEKTYVTNSGLGYREYAVLDSNFKVIEINANISQTSYYLGKITALYPYEYDINYKIIIPKEEHKQEITIEEIEQQITLTEARGERVIKYLDKYKGQSIYNEIALAIEFGYQLKLEEDE